MATNLITKIPIFVFSSQIEDIEFSTDQEKLIITLEDGTTEIYRTSLYAFEGSIILSNIGEVIEDYMRKNGDVFKAFTVYYNQADGTNLGSFNLNTLFCSLVLKADAAYFGSYNFLTSLNAKRIPRGVNEMHWLFHGQDKGVRRMKLLQSCQIR